MQHVGASNVSRLGATHQFSKNVAHFVVESVANDLIIIELIFINNNCFTWQNIRRIHSANVCEPTSKCPLVPGKRLTGLKFENCLLGLEKRKK